MNLLILALALMAPVFDKKDDLQKLLPPVQQKVKSTLKFEKILFIRISGNGTMLDLQNAVKKVGEQHKIDNLMIYGEQLIPVLMPRAEYEKHKNNPHFINVEALQKETKKQLGKNKET